jgi:hypothetical protein
MSFESSMKHHNFRSEMMSYANLVQNQMLIYQSQAMLQAQQQTNALLEENERIRRQEKQIDIWMEEFKFQGLSPIQAHKQALAELEINEIKELAIAAENEYEYLKGNAIEIVRQQISNKPMRKALLGNWSGKFIAISHNSDEVFMFESTAGLNFKNKIIEFNKKLKKLPQSKLFDDSEIRDLFESIENNETPLEVIQKISDSLDEILNQFNSMKYEWANVSIDFNSRRSRYPLTMVDKYEEIRMALYQLEVDLSKFSENIKTLFKTGSLFDEFKTKIKMPFSQLEKNLVSFEKLIQENKNEA